MKQMRTRRDASRFHGEKFVTNRTNVVVRLDLFVGRRVQSANRSTIAQESPGTSEILDDVQITVKDQNEGTQNASSVEEQNVDAVEQKKSAEKKFAGRRERFQPQKKLFGDVRRRKTLMSVENVNGELNERGDESNEQFEGERRHGEKPRRHFAQSPEQKQIEGEKKTDRDAGVNVFVMEGPEDRRGFVVESDALSERVHRHFDQGRLENRVNEVEKGDEQKTKRFDQRNVSTRNVERRDVRLEEKEKEQHADQCADLFDVVAPQM